MKKKKSTEYVDIPAVVIAGTAKSLLLEFNRKKIWTPKSLIDSGKSQNFRIAYWFAKKHALL